MIYIIIESIVLCIIFSLIVIIGTKNNPVAGLHNLPMKIQNRVHKLPEYKDKATKILSTKEKIIRKIPAIIIIFMFFTLIIYFNDARTFFDGFIYSFLLWLIVKLYVVFVLDCLWYAHSPKYWIKGTEDLKDEYKNYKFYMSSIPRSLFLGVMISSIIGVIMMLIN